ncbi:hypothetical protein F2981_09080 [Sinorhizobium meliloti]|nr:hypothetical protein [Sinorhizobium meliloti]
MRLRPSPFGRIVIELADERAPGINREKCARRRSTTIHCRGRKPFGEEVDNLIFTRVSPRPDIDLPTFSGPVSAWDVVKRSHPALATHQPPFEAGPGLDLHT